MGRPRIAGGYDAARAARRPRKLRYGTALWCRVRSLLDELWSPKQIAVTLKQENPGQIALQASHETIYTAIYARPKG